MGRKYSNVNSNQFKITCAYARGMQEHNDHAKHEAHKEEGEGNSTSVGVVTILFATGPTACTVTPGMLPLTSRALLRPNVKLDSDVSRWWITMA